MKWEKIKNNVILKTSWGRISYNPDTTKESLISWFVNITEV